MRVAIVVVLALVLGACGGNPSGGGGSGEPFEADATVIDTPADGPVLCTGPVAESYPPQCTGVRITNWDWDAVEGELVTPDATWGEYHVTGTLRDDSFTVLEARHRR